MWIPTTQENVVSAGPTDGWTDAAETWTYASASTFTVVGDQTTRYGKGTRLKFTNTTAKYGVVAGSAFGGGVTTVTIMVNDDFPLVNAAISANYYSYAASPQGYPGWFNYPPAATGFSAKALDQARFYVVGTTCSVNFNIDGTSNATTFTIGLPVTVSANQVGHFTAMQGVDSGTNVNPSSRINFPASAVVATLGKSFASDGGWTAGGTNKGANGFFSYEF